MKKYPTSYVIYNLTKHSPNALMDLLYHNLWYDLQFMLKANLIQILKVGIAFT